jgi:hypothetical protein
MRFIRGNNLLNADISFSSLCGQEFEPELINFKDKYELNKKVKIMARIRKIS